MRAHEEARGKKSRAQGGAATNVNRCRQSLSDYLPIIVVFAAKRTVKASAKDREERKALLWFPIRQIPARPWQSLRVMSRAEADFRRDWGLVLGR